MPDALWQFYPWLHLAGRVLYALFPIVFGAVLLLDLMEASRFLEQKAVAGPRVVGGAAGLMLLVGGVLVAAGWHRFVGAGLVFLVLVPGAWALFPFWHAADPAVRRAEMAQFLMMVGLAGGALFTAFYGYQEWPLSLGG